MADSRHLCVTSSQEGVFHYAQISKQNGEDRRERVKKQLHAILKDASGEDIAISTTGSDGRAENKLFDSRSSNIEYIGLVWQNASTPLAKEILERVRSFSSGPIDNVETKCIETDTLALFESRDWLSFPTRIWDSYHLWGNEQLIDKGREQVSQEIIQDSRIGRNFKQRLDVHRRVVRIGRVTFKSHFIPEFSPTGECVHFGPYSPVPNALSEGFKAGPLRVVQYSLAYALVRRIRDTQTHPLFVKDIPTNIIDRLAFLKTEGLTRHSEKDIRELQYMYGYFLKLHHDIQYLHLMSGGTEFFLNPDDAKDIKAMLEAVLQLTKPEDFY